MTLNDEPLTIDYSDFVRRLAKPGQDILAGMTPEQANLMHMAIGIAEEAGELLGAIKKHVIYGKPLDVANVIEELGDLFFYIEGMSQAVGVSRNHVLQQNVAKLAVRYESLQYSDQAAAARADKAGES